VTESRPPQGRWSWYHDASGRKRDWYCEDVLSGRLAIRRVFEDDRVLAFHHRDPEAEIHVVVIPKRHVSSVLDPAALDGELLSSMMRAVQDVARQLRLHESGFQLRVNAAVPGVTPHMHWHVMVPGVEPKTTTPK
jgi:histidine triad (HIT) family protein